MKKIMNFIKKRNVLIVLLLVIIVVVIASLYQTFASNSTIAPSDETYAVTLTDSVSTVSIPAGSSKTIVYKITNSTEGTVKYGVGYSGSNITVKVYDNSKDPETGNINHNENKFVKLKITNSGSTDSTATILTIMGYANGGNLVVPTGVTLVTERYSNINEKGSNFINNLFKPNTTAVNNSVTYNLDSVNNLMEDTDGNIRYYGAIPNNYIYFNCDNYPDTNCEKWRIIGVFGGKLKIIRAESIGDYSWDTSASTINNGVGINEWNEANLMILLNSGLYYSAKSGNCYSGSDNKTTTCDFTTIGLKNDTTKNMISNYNWNLGAWNSSSNFYPDQSYDAERARGDIIIVDPLDGEEMETEWKGKIALPYPSDYGYATDLSQCKQILTNYRSDISCTDNDWLFEDYSYWLLTPDFTDNYMGLTVYGGDVWQNISVHFADGVRPTLYLNSDTVIESGSGTEDDPYRIS